MPFPFEGNEFGPSIEGIYAPPIPAGEYPIIVLPPLPPGSTVYDQAGVPILTTPPAPPFAMPGDGPPDIGPQSPDDPPAGDFGDLIRLGDPADGPTLPPGGLESFNYEDGSSNLKRPGARFPEWSYDPFEGFQERLPGPFIGQWQPQDTQTRPRDIPWPDDNPGSPPSTVDEAARRRQGARERDAIIREAARRGRADTAVRRGRGVIEGVVRRAVPRIARRVFGPIGDALFPEPLGSGEVDPEEMARREAEAIERQIDDLERRTREIFDPYRVRRAGPEIASLPEPAPPVLSPPWPAPSPIASPMPSPLPAPPQTSTPRLPSPAPTTTRIPAPSPASVPQAPPWLWPVVGGIASALMGGATMTGAARLRVPAPSVVVPDPLSPPFPGPGVDPLTPRLTRFDTNPLGFSPPATRTRTRQRECKCEPKKRKKRRECTTRGNLVWSSGPKKGRPAGSRCINFKGKP